MQVFAIQQKPVDIDLKKRILRNAVVITRSLASDGYCVDPVGVDLSDYQRNPVVEYRHGRPMTAEPTVIGRSLELARDDIEIVSTTQFADTALARDYAYLYGVNDAEEVFMRAWSADIDLLKQGSIGISEARRFAAGAAWNEKLAQKLARATGALHLATEARLTSYSAVAIGADRGALSRAWEGGNETAGALIAHIDLDESATELAALKRDFRIYQEAQEKRVQTLEAELQALRSDGAAAASQGNAAELLAAIRDLSRTASRN